jgi:hypothetical protein
MFCAKCGTQIEGGSRFCQKCGASVPPPAGQYDASFQPTAAPATAPPAQPASYQPGTAVKTSGMAIASLILGIIGMISIPTMLLSILAIIFGAIGMGQVNKSNGLLKGKGMAVTGIILGILAILLTIAVIAFFGFAWSMWSGDFMSDFSDFTY